MFCGIFPLFLTPISFFLWGQNYIVRANKVVIFKKYSINNNKKEKKESQKHNISKMHI